MKQDLQDVILKRFDSVKNMSSSEITGMQIKNWE
jgi:hypothetical protein